MPKVWLGIREARPAHIWRIGTMYSSPKGTGVGLPACQSFSVATVIVPTD